MPNTNYWNALSDELKKEVGIQLQFIKENHYNSFLNSLYKNLQAFGHLSDKQMKALLSSKQFNTTKSFPPL